MGCVRLGLRREYRVLLIVAEGTPRYAFSFQQGRSLWIYREQRTIFTRLSKKPLTLQIQTNWKK